MNYINEIAKLLGVEVGEEFEIAEHDEHTRYRLTDKVVTLVEKRFENDEQWNTTNAILYILAGVLTIRKIPWKPEKGDGYYYYTSDLYGGQHILCEPWDYTVNDLMRFASGNCFRTKKEAEIKGKELMEQLEKEYEEE